MAKVNHVRIYPGVVSGFDVILRVRGGIVKHGNFPSLDDALAAGRATDRSDIDGPIYIYERSFPDMLASKLVASGVFGGSE